MTASIATIRNGSLISRQEQLAAESAVLLDKGFQPGVKLYRGALLGKIVSSGKYRAVWEVDVATGGDLSTGAATFTFDVSSKLGQGQPKIADVITSVSGIALGTILTYNETTGVGTLAANSANALAAGQKVKISEAFVALGNKAGRILKDETEVDADYDTVAVAYHEGFFISANVGGFSAAALAALGGYTVESGEIRLGSESGSRAASVPPIVASNLTAIAGTYADLPAAVVSVTALRAEVETRLDAAEAKINELIAALKAAT